MAPQLRFRGWSKNRHPKSRLRRLLLSGAIIQPQVFTSLATQERGAGNEIQLTDALAKQIGKAPFTGLRFSGTRFDCGSKLGYLQANIAFALDRPDMADELQSWIKESV